MENIEELENSCNAHYGNFVDDYEDCKQHNKKVKKYLENENQIKQELHDKDNQIKELESKLQESENKYKYLLADLDNIKKRYNKQIDDLRNYEGEKILFDLLEIYDNLDMGSKYNNEESIPGKTNYNLVKTKLLDILKKYGVELIYKDKRPAYFNDQYDEAIFSQTCEDKALDNSISNVFQQGFFFKDKILRFEKVIVNKYNAI